MEAHISRKKPHRCHLCGRRIPIGHLYFCQNGGDEREHYNCEEYKSEPLLHPWFNGDRKQGELKYTPLDMIDQNGRLIEP